jgi:hypothetical protein
MAEADDKLDPEIQEVIAEEKKLARGKGRESSKRERILRIFGEKAWQAIKAKDEKMFSELLRRANVREGSRSGSALGTFTVLLAVDLDLLYSFNSGFLFACR